MTLTKRNAAQIEDVFGLLTAHEIPSAMAAAKPAFESYREARPQGPIAGLKAANIMLNRKMLSEIAICDPAGFDAIVDLAKSASSKAAA